MAIIKNRTGQESEVPESEIQQAITRHFRPFENRIFLNVYFCGWEMDVALITKARLLWEFEIKITLADWKADEKKRKWGNTCRKYVSRFYYVVPENLLQDISKIPDHVTSKMGLLAIRLDNNGGLEVVEVRSAKRFRGSEPISHVQMIGFLEKTYFKYLRSSFFAEDQE